MTITQIPRYWNKNIFIIGLIAVLTACGGGGGGNDNDPIEPPPPVSDTTPDSFTFTAVSNADVNAVVESNSITVDGINAATEISITGGEYKIASGVYTTSDSTITDGQSVMVRLTTSETGSTANQATLTIGDVSATFSVTTRPDDTTPNTFAFPAVTGVTTETQTNSETITISGINTATPISITGGEYSISGGSYTAADGTITNDQTVAVRLNSSADTNTETQAVLTIGELSAHFSVTTAPDTTPATFSFTPITDAALGAAFTSDPITVSDIDVAVPISITGGEYAIDGGDFTAVESMVNAGQTVVVRATASDSLNTLQAAILSIGGVQGSFEITTLADTTAPVAEFMFPPPVSMTEGSTLYVRLQISDEYSDIAGAQIKLDTANEWQDLTLVTHADGTVSWDAEVSLEDGDNTLVVATEDSANNREESAAQVMVHRDAALGSFPSADNPMTRPVGIALDKPTNRLMVIDYKEEVLFEVNLNTGTRELFSDFSGIVPTAPEDVLIYEKEELVLVRDISGRIITVDINDPSIITSHDLSDQLGQGGVFVFDDLQEDLIASNFWSGSLWRIAPDFSEAILFSDNETDIQGPIIGNRSRGIAYDKVNQRYLLAVHGEQAIYSIDLDGNRSLFSDNNIGEGENFSDIGEGFIWKLAVDDQKQRLLALEAETGNIFYIDLETRDRSVVSSPEYPNSLNQMTRITGLAVNTFDSYAFVSDELIAAIFAVDLVTGNRVCISRN